MIFVRIVTPLCMPVLATITLFVAVGSWNSWFDTFLYNPSSQHLSTLQYELQKLLASARTTGNAAVAGVNAAAASGAQQTVSPTSLQAAMAIITSVPILVVYPFLQRYFVTGMMLGGVKE